MSRPGEPEPIPDSLNPDPDAPDAPEETLDPADADAPAAPLSLDLGEAVDRVQPLPGGRFRSSSDGAVMVPIPAGWFVMGCPAGELFSSDDAKPLRRVFLDAYLVDLAPVTNERFQRFVEAGGYARSELWSAEGWRVRRRSGWSRPVSFDRRGFDDAEQPVAGVSWFEAEAYCLWARKALPTEAQWERAARGEDGRRFPWGEALPRSAFCNFNDNVGRTTVPGEHPSGRSPHGLEDMAGNVNNWCLDWYWKGFYVHCREHDLLRNPVLDDALRSSLGLSLRRRADRGGGFATAFGCWEVVSTTGRLGWAPETRRIWHGFRCVLPLPATGS